MAPAGKEKSEDKGRKWLAHKKWRIVAYSLAALLILYSIVGFLVAPNIVEGLLPKLFDEHLKISASVDDVDINPFALSVTVKGFAAQTPDGEPFVDFKELYVNFALWSLIGKSFHFQEIRLQEPNGQIIRLPGNRFNFTPIIENRAAASQDNNQPAKIPALSIGHLTIMSGRFTFTDLSLSTAYETVVSPIDLDLQDFSTLTGKGNQYQLKASIKKGGDITVAGDLTVNPPGSQGTVNIKNLSIPAGWEYIKDWVRFEVTEGLSDMDIHYDISLGEQGPNIAIQDTSVVVTDFKVAEKGKTAPFLHIPSLEVQGVSADLYRKNLQVASVNSRDTRLDVWIEPDGSLGLTSILSMTSAEKQKELITETKTEAEQIEQDWQMTVDRIRLDNYTVDFENRSLLEPFKLKLAPIKVSLDHLTNRKNEKANVNIIVKDAVGGSVTVSGSSGIDPMHVDMEVKIDQIALAQFEPYVKTVADLVIVDGVMASNGRFVYADKKTDNAPRMRYEGGFEIENLKANDPIAGKDFFKMQRLAIDDILFEVEPNRLQIAEISVSQPRTDLVINPDGSVNIQKVLKPKTEGVEKMKNSVLGKLIRNALLQIEGPMPFRIDRMSVADGSVLMTDRSVQPTFKLNLNPYNVNIKKLDSVADTEIPVAFNGTINGKAALKANGGIDPFGEERSTRMTVTMDNFDVPGLSPYSGKYAGYKLEQGKLNLDLSYTVSQKQVDGKNEIRLQKLTLGEKTDSPDAVSLPLELAVALLKDSKGDINLDVPIQGNLDDPKFQIGGVLTNTIVNLITSVVTSPFAVLGGIAGAFSAEELSRVAYQPGSTILAPPEEQKLDALIQALSERPALFLQIKGTVHPPLDRKALAQQEMVEKAAALKPKELKKAGIDASIKLENIQPGSADYERLLPLLYEQQVGRLPETFDFENPEDLRGLEAELLEKVVINEDDLQQLAKLRADRVSAYLTSQGGIAADRIYKAKEDFVEETKDNQVYTILKVTTK